MKHAPAAITLYRDREECAACAVKPSTQLRRLTGTEFFPEITPGIFIIFICAITETALYLTR